MQFWGANKVHFGRCARGEKVKISNTTTLHMHHAILKIYLPSLHDYDVKMPN